MAKTTKAEPAKVNRSLPPPLDKPMETFNLDYSGTLDDREIMQIIHELIERQNALVEYVKALAAK